MEIDRRKVLKFESRGSDHFFSFAFVNQSKFKLGQIFSKNLIFFLDQRKKPKLSCTPGSGSKLAQRVGIYLGKLTIATIFPYIGTWHPLTRISFRFYSFFG
jgi:hypothetical protein